MPSPPAQPVPTRTTRSSNPHPSNPPRTGASPMSYGAMTGISFTNGGGFSFEGKPKSFKWGNGGMMGSFGAKYYGDAGGDSPMIPFSSSITMEPSSFAASAHAFGLPPGSLSSSYHRRSYAAAVSGREAANLSTSFASMSFQPMSLGTSYNRSQVQGLMRSDAELTKAYECCNKTHSGLHALLEHVEDCHPFADPNMQPEDTFSPVTHAMDLDLEDVEEESVPVPASGSSHASLSPHSAAPVPVPNYPLPKASPTDIGTNKSPLKLSDVLKSPPDGETLVRPSNLTLTRTQSSSSSPPEGSIATPTASTHPSPNFIAPKMNPSRPAFLGSNAMRPALSQKRFDRAFNEVVAGKKDDDKSDVPTAVAPGVLFASAVSSLGIPTVPPGTKTEQPATPAPKEGETSTPTEAPKAPSAASTPGSVDPAIKPAGTPTSAAPTTQNKGIEAALPQPSLFSSHKPWRCPNPGCNKAYKQSNGLKYHQQKGQCDFAIHDAVDLGLTLEEAEERNRPFVCAVGAGCTKRYRQMNGLKYHYLNSGEHGLYGLRMLQNGTHPHPPSLPAPPAKARPTPLPSSTAHGNAPISRPTGAPYAIPSHANHAPHPGQQGRVVGQGPGHHPNGHGPPRMGTWPAQRPANGVSVPNPRPNGHPHPPPRPQARPPPQPQPQPVTKGRDAVLFSAVGSEDPMDIMSRMDQ
ncbi:hypothetical protein L202_03663 [Cryptococcus amylolentus CBS 6039]|uniref:C2H2-type domain-containing protein n=1 Tax=Cryptococcus amylolentus CBS 6039 TaxID=1295533 RepID=A0A1E3HTS1_9TREE|nr:hypothetical protein L202_03663 [Cryptococcus amylolentus CBS 6039]ODN79750.1 hypothetical protein L202_03663 [Cryptococcus amylolentus CBS 6039]